MDPKYAAIISEYERLQTDLATPARFAREARRAVTRDQAKLKETSQRFRQLEPAVGLIGELEQTARQLAAARDSVEHETDDELLTLANQEVAELTERAARLAKEIETERGNPLRSKQRRQARMRAIVLVRVEPVAEEDNWCIGTLVRIVKDSREDHAMRISK